MLKYILLALLLPLTAQAGETAYLYGYFNKQPQEVVGKGEYHKLFFHVYDATLFSPDGTYDPKNVFALQLDYKMDLSGADIAEKSIDEMQKIKKIEAAKAAKWLAQMKAIFPDVKEGDFIVGINLVGKGAAFLKNGQKVGQINDPQFAKEFFDIWLSPKTSDKGLRRELLGESK